MSRPVRFEDEAEAEYLEAGRWYDAKQAGLGIEFFDEVNATIRRILDLPHAGSPVPRVARSLPPQDGALKSAVHADDQAQSP